MEGGCGKEDPFDGWCEIRGFTEPRLRRRGILEIGLGLGASLAPLACWPKPSLLQIAVC